MIPRSGKGNLFLVAIILKVAASFKFYITDQYHFLFLFVSLFLRMFWSHGAFTVKESSCPEKCLSSERKAVDQNLSTASRVLPTLVLTLFHAKESRACATP